MADMKNPGLKYDSALRNEAADKHEFVVVRSLDAKGNTVKSKPSNRKVTGLPNFLLKPENRDIIYNFNLRITGTESDIRAALRLAGFSESEIREAVSGRDTVWSGNINEPEVQRMIMMEKSLAKDAPEVYDTQFTLDDLAFLGYKITTSARVLPIKGAKVSEITTRKVSKGRRGGAIKANLMERAEAARPDKALNVTGLKEDMSGAKCCYVPRQNTSKTMVYLPEYNIVSSEEKGVRMFLKHIGADKAATDRTIAEWKAKKEELQSKKSSRSPRGRPGGPIEVPPAARKGKARTDAGLPYRKPKSPARSPRGGRPVASPGDYLTGSARGSPSMRAAPRSSVTGSPRSLGSPRSSVSGSPRRMTPSAAPTVAPSGRRMAVM